MSVRAALRRGVHPRAVARSITPLARCEFLVQRTVPNQGEPGGAFIVQATDELKLLRSGMDEQIALARAKFPP
jgi:hypothetical protein